LQAGIGGLQLAVFQDQWAVYMQEIPQSVVEALEGRTQAILGIKAVKKTQRPQTVPSPFQRAP
jgi:hypothetical protein